MSAARPPEGAQHRSAKHEGTPVNRGERHLGLAWLLAGFAFLYLPIAALVVASFNASPLPGRWGGFTLEGYARLAQDRDILAGLWLSLRIAFFSATASVVLGTLAAHCLTRYHRFGGRLMFAGMLNAPLVMPQVVVGLALLLTLVAVQKATGYPERGFATLWIGHVLLGMAYATVVIAARLRELPPALREAALDLGASPAQAFFLVTLPMAAPSLAAAWLLAFSLSLDNLVISAFLSGPGSQTLPLVIFARARLGADATVNAVATLTVAAVAVGITAASLWLAWAERRRSAEVRLAAASAGLPSS